jgi:hypothetical protein
MPRRKTGANFFNGITHEMFSSKEIGGLLGRLKYKKSGRLRRPFLEGAYAHARLPRSL